MRPRSVAKAAGAALVFVLWSLSAHAQGTTSPGTFGNMPGKVKAGNVVIVIDNSGREVRGKVTAVSETSLAILAKDDSGQWTAPTTFTPANVREVKRTGKIWDKALLGFGIGAVAIALVDCSDNCDAELPQYVLATGGIGAGIGFAFDAAFGPSRVYRAPTAQKAGLMLQPIVAPRRTGAVLAYRF